MESRITSYNVCYTKLLRASAPSVEVVTAGPASARSPSSLSGPRRKKDRDSDSSWRRESWKVTGGRSRSRIATEADLAALAVAPPGRRVTVLVPEAGDVHEDDAARRLATAVAGGDPGVSLRGPVQSRNNFV